MLSHLDEIYVIGLHYVAATCRRCSKVMARAGLTGQYYRGTAAAAVIAAASWSHSLIHRYTDRDERFGGALDIDLRKNGTYLTEPRVNRGDRIR